MNKIILLAMTLACFKLSQAWALPSYQSNVAYWPLAATSGTIAQDTSGNGHTGTLVNGAVPTASGVTFDGVNDYVNAGKFDIPGNALSISAWFWADNLANCTENDCRIISKAIGLGEQDHYFLVSPIKVGTATRLRFRLKTNGVTSTLTASSGNLSNKAWIHVAAVYNGQTMRLYKDGVEVGSMAKTGSLTTNSASAVWIGGNPPSASARPWKGKIADVGLYNGALTKTEIAELAGSNGADPVPDSTPPVISNIQASVTDTTVAITWATNEAANSRVNYGLTSGYGANNSNASLVTAHSITLTGLAPNTTYHYQVRSTDASGNTAHSTDRTFTTNGRSTQPPSNNNLLVYDWNKAATVSDHGVPANKPPLAAANGNWTTPINYVEGTLYLRAQIKSQPVAKSMKLQFCIWQYNYTLEACVNLNVTPLMVGNTGTIATWSAPVANLWKKNGVPIDWKNPRQQYAVVIKRSPDFLTVSDYNGWNWHGEDPKKWFPLDMRFTVVAVPKGGTFIGWDKFI